MTERESFLSAIRDNPDDDTVRLAYADWLDENSEPRACPACKNGWRSYRGAEFGYETEPCPDCNRASNPFGPGRVRGEYGDRAELIRVQVELSNREKPVSETNTPQGKSLTFDHGADYERLRSRSIILLAAHPEWLAECPHCYRKPRQQDCIFCLGKVRIGSVKRGFLDSVEVPTMSVLFERKPEACPHCIHWKGRVPNDCICGGTRRVPTGDWTATAWARALVADHALLTEIRVRDRVPGVGHTTHSAVGFSWSFGDDYHHVPGRVPEFLFDALVGWEYIRDGIKFWGAEPDALSALARATITALRRMCQQ